MDLINEVFALRMGERLSLHRREIDAAKAGHCVLAVMLRSVDFPGPMEPRRQTDRAPVQQCAILAAQRSADGLWQWCPLSTPSKESIGDYLFDIAKPPQDEWFYLAIGGTTP